MTEYKRDDADELMDKLTRPFYVLRMARAKLQNPPYGNSPHAQSMVKSAQASAEKAKREIWEIVHDV